MAANRGGTKKRGKGGGGSGGVVAAADAAAAVAANSGSSHASVIDDTSRAFAWKEANMMFEDSRFGVNAVELDEFYRCLFAKPTGGGGSAGDGNGGGGGGDYSVGDGAARKSTAKSGNKGKAKATGGSGESNVPSTSTSASASASASASSTTTATDVVASCMYSYGLAGNQAVQPMLMRRVRAPPTPIVPLLRRVNGMERGGETIDRRRAAIQSLVEHFVEDNLTWMRRNRTWMCNMDGHCYHTQEDAHRHIVLAHWEHIVALISKLNSDNEEEYLHFVGTKLLYADAVYTTSPLSPFARPRARRETSSLHFPSSTALDLDGVLGERLQTILRAGGAASGGGGGSGKARAKGKAKAFEHRASSTGAASLQTPLPALDERVVEGLEMCAAVLAPSELDALLEKSVEGESIVYDTTFMASLDAAIEAQKERGEAPADVQNLLVVSQLLRSLRDTHEKMSAAASNVHGGAQPTGDTAAGAAGESPDTPSKDKGAVSAAGAAAAGKSPKGKGASSTAASTAMADKSSGGAGVSPGKAASAAASSGGGSGSGSGSGSGGMSRKEKKRMKQEAAAAAAAAEKATEAQAAAAAKAKAKAAEAEAAAARTAATADAATKSAGSKKGGKKQHRRGDSDKSDGSGGASDDGGGGGGNDAAATAAATVAAKSKHPKIVLSKLPARERAIVHSLMEELAMSAIDEVVSGLLDKLASRSLSKAKKKEAAAEEERKRKLETAAKARRAHEAKECSAYVDELVDESVRALLTDVSRGELEAQQAAAAAAAAMNVPAAATKLREQQLRQLEQQQLHMQQQQQQQQHARVSNVNLALAPTHDVLRNQQPLVQEQAPVMHRQPLQQGLPPQRMMQHPQLQPQVVLQQQQQLPNRYQRYSGETYRPPVQQMPAPGGQPLLFQSKQQPYQHHQQQQQQQQDVDNRTINPTAKPFVPSYSTARQAGRQLGEQPGAAALLAPPPGMEPAGPRGFTVPPQQQQQQQQPYGTGAPPPLLPLGGGAVQQPPSGAGSGERARDPVPEDWNLNSLLTVDVSNLAASTRKEDLAAFFQQKGATVARHAQDGRVKIHFVHGAAETRCFVEFADMIEYRRALELEGCFINGKSMRLAAGRDAQTQARSSEKFTLKSLAESYDDRTELADAGDRMLHGRHSATPSMAIGSTGGLAAVPGSGANSVSPNTYSAAFSSESAIGGGFFGFMPPNNADRASAAALGTSGGSVGGGGGGSGNSVSGGFVQQPGRSQQQQSPDVGVSVRGGGGGGGGGGGYGAGGGDVPRTEEERFINDTISNLWNTEDDAVFVPQKKASHYSPSKVVGGMQSNGAFADTWGTSLFVAGSGGAAKDPAAGDTMLVGNGNGGKQMSPQHHQQQQLRQHQPRQQQQTQQQQMRYSPGSPPQQQQQQGGMQYPQHQHQHQHQHQQRRAQTHASRNLFGGGGGGHVDPANVYMPEQNDVNVILNAPYGMMPQAQQQPQQQQQRMHRQPPGLGYPVDGY